MLNFHMTSMNRAIAHFGINKATRIFKRVHAQVWPWRTRVKHHCQIAPGNTVELGPARSLRRKPLLVSGEGNQVIVHPQANIDHLKIEIKGRNNRVVIGRNCRLRGELLVDGRGSQVCIGEETTFKNVYILCAEGRDVLIGKWCMFSRSIEIRTTDAHSLIDVATGERVNKAGSIHIGDHVWIGLGVIVNKGVSIADDNVVAASSFVNRSFQDSQTVIAGIPAKVVREGVTWHRARKEKFTPEEMYHWQAGEGA